MGAAAAVSLVAIVGLGPARRWLVHRYSGDYTPPSGATAGEPGAAESPVSLRIVATGFVQPTDIQFVPGLPNTAVVLEKGGHARVVQLSNTVAKPGGVVLDEAVKTDSELGLLGLAFHPKWRQNGLFYVNENPAAGPLRTEIVEFRSLPADLGKRSAERVRTVLSVEQPYQNHDAGQLAFGPDDKLYIGLGDGGWRADPKGNGQNLGTLLGSILRIDVDRPEDGRQYAVPADNPFVDRSGARPEIWAYGLRNPWRFSFDPSGRLIVADVGQDAWEEVDIVARGDNLGWNVREGRHCFSPKTDCPSRGLVDPVFEYGHDQGQSITGGYVYTGKAIPSLSGRYLAADFAQGRLWALALGNGNEPAAAESLGKFAYLISTFGRDASGELYVGDYASGALLKLVPSNG